MGYEPRRIPGALLGRRITSARRCAEDILEYRKSASPVYHAKEIAGLRS